MAFAVHGKHRWQDSGIAARIGRERLQPSKRLTRAIELMIRGKGPGAEGVHGLIGA